MKKVVSSIALLTFHFFIGKPQWSDSPSFGLVTGGSHPEKPNN